MFCRTVEESLPQMTPKDVRKMKKKVADFYGAPKQEKDEAIYMWADSYTSSQNYTNMNVYESTKSRLASLWYVAHLVHKQGNFVVGLGLLSLGAALCFVAKTPLNKEALYCLSATGALLGFAGFFHKREAVIAEKAASRSLECLEKKENSEMTQREARAVSKLSLSFTNIVLTAFQPMETSPVDPRLLGNRGYKVWKKWFSKHQHVKD